jgi:hypothetical protein
MEALRIAPLLASLNFVSPPQKRRPNLPPLTFLGPITRIVGNGWN